MDSILSVQDLKLLLRSKFKRIWRCADSGVWDLMQQQGLLSFNWLDPTLDYSNMDKAQIGAGKNAIYPFTHALREGDLVFVMGKNKFYGIGIAKSAYRFGGPDLILRDGTARPAVIMDYFFNLTDGVDHNFITHNNPATFADIDKYKFSLQNTLTFLQSFYPEGYDKLSQLVNNGTISVEVKEKKLMQKPEVPLNQILYGPPGTGKTYHTVNKAIQIIRGYSDAELKTRPRADLKAEFDALINEGQIVFSTFHQSMTYEDFVEGIKPIQNEDDASTLGYEVQPGIFKRICDRAKAREVSNASTAWDKANYFKMSLGGKNRTDLHEWCLENNLLGLGWGGENDLTQYAKLNNWENFRDKFSRDQPAVVAHSRFNIQAAYSFLQMRKGDVVIISKGNHLIDSIGIVDGDYFFDENKPIEFVHFRPVKWVVKRINEVPGLFVTKGISQQSIYQFAKDDVILDSFKAYSPENSDRRIKPYVLIIDEINRGNVSQIFGELITLLEADKRLGRDEALEVTLPYSKEKEKFGVPANLYIIGTMNTADRSVEALDTALRRRFSFTEMPPNYELKELEYSFAGTTGKEILKTINQRIEKLLDRDHLIGHSYLMIKEGENFESKLMDAFYRNIIPLLQEYFYGDYAKIGAVLGKGFIDKKADADKIEFADFDYFEAADYSDKVIYEIIDHRSAATPAESFEQAIRTLMNPKK